MVAVWRLMGAIMIGRTAVGIAIAEAAVRLLLCNELSTAIFIFPTAHLLGPPVLRLFVRDNRDMDVIWTGTGMVWDASKHRYMGAYLGA